MDLHKCCSDINNKKINLVSRRLQLFLHVSLGKDCGDKMANIIV